MGAASRSCCPWQWRASACRVHEASCHVSCACREARRGWREEGREKGKGERGQGDREGEKKEKKVNVERRQEDKQGEKSVRMEKARHDRREREREMSSKRAAET